MMMMKLTLLALVGAVASAKFVRTVPRRRFGRRRLQNGGVSIKLNEDMDGDKAKLKYHKELAEDIAKENAFQARRAA